LTGRIATRRGRLVAGALATALGALALTGCGDATAPGDATAGKGLFSSGCASCHTLADADAKGTIGPDLDDAFRQARQDGWEKSQIHAVVREWISLAQPPMPRDIYEGQEAADVAAYVSEVAGTSAESAVRAPRQIDRPKDFGPEQEPPVPGGNQGPTHAAGSE
jgi:mono/diheme cytochrome c family protein